MPTLQPCRECGHQVSESAAACPNCGAVEPRTSHSTLETQAYDKRDEAAWRPFFIAYWLVGLSGLGILAALMPRPDSPVGFGLGLLVVAGAVVLLFWGHFRMRDRQDAARWKAFEEIRRKHEK